MKQGAVSWVVLGCFGGVLAGVGLPLGKATAQTLIVDGTTFNVAPATDRTYDHICVINGGTITVTPYASGGDKTKEGNLELIAGSVYVDASSRIVARGAGYQARQCYHGDGPTEDSGGRGGCAVADSGGGGAHFGRGGRGTIDAPTSFPDPTHYEDNCDDCSSGTCSHTWTGSGCTSLVDCGVDTVPCPGGRAGRICKVGPTVAGSKYWHDIYEPDFGAAGGDKGCRDNNAFAVVTGGAGGGRVVVVGLDHLTSVITSTCGVGLTRGQVRIDGDIDAGGKRGCGIGNDSGGGGAGGTVLIVGQNVTIGSGAVIAANGALGGDTRAANSNQPNYQDCAAGAQTTGTCDDCGGGGGGGIISVLSVTSTIDPAAEFNVSGADGGTCDVCKGEAGGGAGELQIDGAYVGEYCDGYDNDFDGLTDEGLGMQTCGLGTCAESIAACASGQPVTCDPTVTSDPSCSEDPTGARPRIAVILDTSASMLLSLDGYPTFGDGSLEHPGLDLDGNGEPDDSRLYLARTALGEVMSAYPEIDFALARYHQDQAAARNCQTASWFECQDLVASYDDPTGNTGPMVCSVDIGPSDTISVNQTPVSPEECINYAGSCGGPRRGADILGGFGMPVRDLVRWVDGKETGFNASATPGNVCNHAGGGDCEVRGSGPTPLAGSLLSAEDYLVPIRTTDAAAACRSYAIILVTDGAESCNGDPEAAANRLHDMFDIDVHVVAVSVLPEEEASLNDIAAAGGTTEATFVTSPEQLVPALTSIIAGSIRLEECDNEDDDCDTFIDEGLPKYCDKPNGIEDSSLCEEPDETRCDGEDDDCDGTLDEGLLNACGECGAVPDEACDGFDNDCDGRTDEGTGGDPCGSDEGQCMSGTLRCVGGELECAGAVGPGEETCDVQDDDCDGLVDEDTGDLLCDGSRCVGGTCIPRCEVGGEFQAQCPEGLTPEFQASGECLCIEDTCDREDCAAETFDRDGELACAPNDPDVAACTCKAGICIARCDGVSCADGDVCHKRTGQCVENNCRGLGCPDAQLCDPLEAMCVTDACAAAACEVNEVCRGGECERSCASVTCDSDELCRAGECVANECAGVRCETDMTCAPRSGDCVASACSGVRCESGLTCDPENGDCVRDACWNVQCPSGELCSQGECRIADTRPDNGNAGAGAPGDDVNSRVLATGGGGCSCRIASGSTDTRTSAPALWLALGGLLVLARFGRRRLREPRRAALGASKVACLSTIALVLGAVLSACEVNPYCLDCVTTDGGDADGSAGASGAFGNTGGMSGAGAGASGVSGDGGEPLDDGGLIEGGAPDACAEIQSEVCNGSDDDCDFRVDEEVEIDDFDCDQLGVCAGTQPICIGGEPACRYSAEHEADETICDSLDNDCDGRVDEAFAMLGDSCSVGIGACLTTGELRCNAAGTGLRCEVGAMPEPAVEECDGIDNDCDSLIDEPEAEPGLSASFVQDALVTLGGGLQMFKYEASRPDATADATGSRTARACSKPDALPWTSVSFATAQTACEAAGYRLCTAAEWLSACEDGDQSAYPYGAAYDGDSCNGADHDTSGATGIQNQLVPTGSLATCESDEGAFDLSGNVKEWTNDPGDTVDGQMLYVVRGGSYESPEIGLRCQTLLSQAIATTVLPTLGFRCCTD